MLGQAGEGTVPSELTDDLPDVLHALVHELARRDSRLTPKYEILRNLHRLVTELAWAGDEFAEKATLLTQISQLAWSCSLELGTASEVRQWEDECLKYFLLQEETRQLVEMPAARWSPAVCERFLSDRSFVVGFWGWLYSHVDFSPGPVSDLTFMAYKWLLTRSHPDAVSGEDSYLLGHLAYVLSGTLRMRGQYAKSRKWLQTAEKWCKSSSNAETLRARIEYGRLAALTEVHRYSDVLLHVPRLIRIFEQLGLDLDIAKARLVQAVAQKELGRDQQATASFSLLKSDAVVQQQPWLKAMVLLDLADLQNRAGDLEMSLCSIREAEILLRGVQKPFVQAHYYGVAAEILRDQGNHIAAVEYYRRSVEIYVNEGMAVMTAYTRLLLAETLVAMGRTDQALDEIIAALPVIERENLVREGIAAVGLLKASLAGRRLDSGALKALRESLKRTRQEAEP